MSNKQQQTTQDTVIKTYKLKLLPKNKEQFNALLRLITQQVDACNIVINKYYCELQKGNKIKSSAQLQKLVYHNLLRPLFPCLCSDHCIQAIRKTFEAIKSQQKLRNAKKRITFKSLVARLNRHTCSIYRTQEVSISVPGKDQMLRIKMPFQCRQDILNDLYAMKYIKFAELKYYRKKKEFYLHITIEYPDVYNNYDKVIGVDIGIKYHLVYADDKTYQIIHDPDVIRKYNRYRKLYALLQAKGTRSSKRRLQSFKGKQTRLGLDTCHMIANTLVEQCIKEKVGIVVLEDLTNIRKNMKKSSKDVNFKRHTWFFRKLQNTIEYKCKLAGIRVVYIKPAYTSITCPRCGHCSKKNRPDRDTFYCQKCQLSGPADVVAAYNIRNKFFADSGSGRCQPSPDACSY